MVKFLLKEKSINVNSKGRDDTPLHMVIKYSKNKDILKLLLDHPKVKINVRDRDGFPALILALHERNTEFAEMILNHSMTNVNIKRSYNTATPLMIATQSSNEKIVKILLDKGARINIEDNNGETVWNYLRGDAAERISILLSETLRERKRAKKQKISSGKRQKLEDEEQ